MKVNLGYLYNWYVTQGTGNSSLIPLAMESLGWGIPTYFTSDSYDILTLSTYLGGDSVSGGKLKEIGIGYWETPNTGASDLVGFKMRGGGTRNGGSFLDNTVSGYLWLNTNLNPTYKKYVQIDYNATTLSIGGYGLKDTGFSIRLVRPASVLEQTYPDGTYLSYYIGNDGTKYRTVKIGTQVWTAVNLAETKYRDLTTIPTVTDNTAWSNLTSSAKCSYNNDELVVFENKQKDSIGISLDFGVIPPLNRQNFVLNQIGVSTDMGVVPPKNYFKTGISVIGISHETVPESTMWYDVNYDIQFGSNKILSEIGNPIITENNKTLYQEGGYIFTNPNFDTLTNFISPSGFTTSDQFATFGEELDLIDKVNTIGSVNTQWIYSIRTTIGTLTHTPKVIDNVSYQMGESVNGTDIFPMLSNTFTANSTKRFVIANQSIGTISMSCSQNASWIIVGKNVTEIGRNTFTTSCKYIHLAGSIITNLVDSSFQDCTGLSGNLTIPTTITTIPTAAFYSCTGLYGSLNIPSSITYIGNSSFAYCSGLSGNLIIPSTVTTIMDSAFVSCVGFTGSLTIPSSLTIINGRIFQDCSGLNGTLTISTGVTYIGGYSFNNTHFTSVIIPSTVTTVAANSFRFCVNLTSIYSYMTSAPIIGTTQFLGVPKTIPLHRPISSTGYNLNYWNQFTNQISDL